MTDLRPVCLLAALTAGAFGGDPGPVATFDGHAAPVVALLLGDGKTAASACGTTFRTWDAATGKEIASRKGVGGRVVALRPDGKRIAVAGRDDVIVYDQDGKAVATIKPHEVPPGRFPFPARVSAVAFSPDGKTLATAASVARVGGPHGYPGGIVKLWDAATGKELRRFDDLSTAASSVAFSGDGKRVVAGTNGAGGELPEPATVWVWETEKADAIARINVVENAVGGKFISASDVALSPDGKQVAAAVGSGSRARPAGLLVEETAATVRLWAVDKGNVLHDLIGHTAAIERISFSPDGKRLASAGGDRAVRVWSTETGKEIQTLPFDTPRIDALAFGPDGQRLAAGCGDAKKPGGIKVWELARD